MEKSAAPTEENPTRRRSEDASRGQFYAHEAFERLRAVVPSIRSSSHKTYSPLPQTTIERREKSTRDESLDSDELLTRKLLDHDVRTHKETGDQETVLYLAYGSNLSAETFRGNRGIEPLSQVNVYVPELRLTFDLPGIPYGEPCFSGTRFRDPSEPKKEAAENDGEGHQLLSQQDYHKDRWHKPLIGVVYEVTLTDYAHIIATEGGGRGYRDMVVTCYPFPKMYSPTDPVPDHPETRPFKAHTLLSPAPDEDDSKTQRTQNPLSRPDPSYAQPSARYINLITTGALEHNLPLSYQTYLSMIRPYRITTFRQRVGQGIFLALWMPLVLLLITLGSYLADADGRSPEWLMKTEDAVFLAMWRSYDGGFRKVFGDGERTIENV